MDDQTFFAAFTDDSIAGLGFSETQAIDDASTTRQEDIDVADVEFVTTQWRQEFSGVKVAECTARLFRHVEDFGGCGFAFHMVDGKLDIDD